MRNNLRERKKNKLGKKNTREAIEETQSAA
jgi:hypothetical protein